MVKAELSFVASATEGTYFACNDRQYECARPRVLTICAAYLYANEVWDLSVLAGDREEVNRQSGEWAVGVVQQLQGLTACVRDRGEDLESIDANCIGGT